MKARFTDEQIIAMTKEQESGEKTADVCRRHEISSATLCKYKSKYGRMEPADAKRLRELEDENGKLKKLLAEQMLDNAMLQDINSKMVTPAVRREAVVHLCGAHGVSQQQACDVLQIDRSTVRYLSRRGDDAELRDAIKRVSKERRRFGCRRIHVMIAREGFEVNHKKAGRIYREEKLQVRRRGGRKRALGTRKPMVQPNGPN